MHVAAEGSPLGSLRDLFTARPLRLDLPAHDQQQRRRPTRTRQTAGRERAVPIQGGLEGVVDGLLLLEADDAGHVLQPWAAIFRPASRSSSSRTSFSMYSDAPPARRAPHRRTRAAAVKPRIWSCRSCAIADRRCALTRAWRPGWGCLPPPRRCRRSPACTRASLSGGSDDRSSEADRGDRPDRTRGAGRRRTAISSSTTSSRGSVRALVQQEQGVGRQRLGVADLAAA